MKKSTKLLIACLVVFLFSFFMMNNVESNVLRQIFETNYVESGRTSIFWSPEAYWDLQHNMYTGANLGFGFSGLLLVWAMFSLFRRS